MTAPFIAEHFTTIGIAVFALTLFFAYGEEVEKQDNGGTWAAGFRFGILESRWYILALLVLWAGFRFPLALLIIGLIFRLIYTPSMHGALAKIGSRSLGAATALHASHNTVAILIGLWILAHGATFTPGMAAYPIVGATIFLSGAAVRSAASVS